MQKGSYLSYKTNIYKMKKINLNLCCKKCGNTFKYVVTRKDLQENQLVPRSMGCETEYTLSEVICPHCNREFEVEVFEYPENTFQVTT